MHDADIFVIEKKQVTESRARLTYFEIAYHADQSREVSLTVIIEVKSDSFDECTRHSVGV